MMEFYATWLPVTGIATTFMVMGFIFLAMEAVVPSFGVLGVLGVLNMVIGVALLLAPAGWVAGWIIPIWFPTLLVLVGALIVFCLYALRVRGKPVVTGTEALIGSVGVVESLNGTCLARIQGELWQCRSDSSLSVGDHVKVCQMEEGMVLKVQKVEV
jgi:membrane-bound serine protease (ClpP class)